MTEIDFAKIEKKWQDKWEKEKVFEVSEDKEKKFFFNTPYPYISGSLHIGHGRAVTEGDIYCRFLRMNNYNVLYPMAFHISGTPVLGISSAIKNKDPEKIKLYFNYVKAYERNDKKAMKIVESFEDPEKIVDFFIPKMIEEYKQLGLSIDWRRSFTSGDFEHQQMVTWQFNKYKELGYLIKEKYPVLYSPKDESSMGEDDIVDGDSNPVEKQEFCLFKFELEDKRKIITATLRPDTVLGITNVYVNPNFEYSIALVNGEEWIISESMIEKLKYQNYSVKKIGKIKGDDLVGKEVKSYGGHKIFIFPATFLDAERGTGIVHAVPSESADDLIALRDLQKNEKLLKDYNIDIKKVRLIEPIEILETPEIGSNPAKYFLDKYNVKSQNERDILNKIRKELYTKSFTSAILGKKYKKGFSKDLSGMKVSEAIEFIKNELLSKKEINLFYEPSRKALSRSGGEIIVAILDDQWFLNFNANGWKKKAFESLKNVEIVPDKFRKDFESTFSWLDKRPCVRKRGLGTKFPYNSEWVIESLSDSTIYMTLYTISHLIKKYKLKREQLNIDFFDYVYLGKGDLNKISKNNKIKEEVLKEIRDSFEYWMPTDHRHTFILHLSNHLSFMLFAFAGIFDEKYWPKKISFHGLVISRGTKMSKSKGNTITLLDIKERYGADTFRFYLTQANNIDGTFDWNDEDAENSKKTLRKLYETIIEVYKNKKEGKLNIKFSNNFKIILKDATEKIKNMELRDYNILVVYEMLNLVQKAKKELNKEELFSFYNLIYRDWIKIISPVVPHVAEELWEIIGENGFVSINLWPDINKLKIEEEKKDINQTIIQDIKYLISKNPSSKKVYIYCMPFELSQINSKIIYKEIERDVKIFTVNDSSKIDPEGKAKKAKPGKPSIYFE